MTSQSKSARILDTWRHAQERVSNGIGWADSWICLILIGVLLYEVVARYLFLSPTAWAHELSTMLYGTLCIIGGVYAQAKHAHVRSEVVYQFLPTWAQAFLDFLTGILTLVALGILFQFSVQYAVDSWAMLEYSSRSSWQPPVYPVKTVIPITVLLIFLQRAAQLVDDIRRFIRAVKVQRGMSA